MRLHRIGPVPACRKAGVRCQARQTNPKGPGSYQVPAKMFD